VPRAFSPATAEQVVATVEAAVVRRAAITPQFAADFGDLSVDQATAGLTLAVDLGLLKKTGNDFEAVSPICRFLGFNNQIVRSSALRVVLESYEPFVLFRDRVAAAVDASDAAQQVKMTLDLGAHREDIKATLVSLGTYCQAIDIGGGGHYTVKATAFGDALAALAAACADIDGAEAAIRDLVGTDVQAVADRGNVIVPLADGLIAARDNDGRGAVVNAGNAVESYLEGMAGRVGVNVGGAHGINAKLDRFHAQSQVIPNKLIFVGKYLGHVRNAADHGIDQDVAAAWTIRPSTGPEYVHVACSFLMSIRLRELNRPPDL
jgi:hypothetical protein